MVMDSSFTDKPNDPFEERAKVVRGILFQIRKLTQAGMLYSKELMKNHQISTPQLHCILALYVHGRLPASQIARHILVKSSTVTGILDRLEEKDLVRRVRNSPDRRVILIELTEKGESLARSAPPPVQQKIIDGLQGMPQQEIQNIYGALSTLTGMLDIPAFDGE